MKVQPVRPSRERAHRQLRPLMLPSPSVSVACTVTPTPGSGTESVTTPSSSTSRTRIETVVSSSATRSVSTVPWSSFPSLTLTGTRRSPVVVSKSSGSTVRSCPVEGLISKSAPSPPSPIANVRVSLSRSVAVTRSPMSSPAPVSGMSWALPVRMRGGALGMGSGVIAAVASLSTDFPPPRRSV